MQAVKWRRWVGGEAESEVRGVRVSGEKIPNSFLCFSLFSLHSFSILISPPHDGHGSGPTMAAGQRMALRENAGQVM